MLSGKKIVVGISGGIAAYKAPLLVRLLVKAGAEVKCVASEHALQFVTLLTLETVSQHKVYTDLFAFGNDHTTEHISLKDWGDAMVVAPATANIIGKLASGIGDDALSTLLLSFRNPLWLCPAMNTQMLECPAVERNIAYLRSVGVRFVEPTSGVLACGTSGKGRMEAPESIVEQMKQFFGETSSLQGCRVLVTAGPTYEKIDAVRFIGNYSTGKMGFAIAKVLAAQGARVTLVAGPTALNINSPMVERINVESAQQMYNVCMNAFPHCDAAVLSAAVADFRPVTTSNIKIKKTSDQQGMTLQLIQTPDILSSLGKIKTATQRLVGFALETNNEVSNAQAKLHRKNLDFIVLNSLQDTGAGFGYDTNKVKLLFRDGTIENGTLKDKEQVAYDIVDALAKILKN